MKNEELIDKILDYRAKYDLSQIEFAKLCKVTTQTISNIECGRQNPTKFTLRKILNVIEKQ